MSGWGVTLPWGSVLMVQHTPQCHPSFDSPPAWHSVGGMRRDTSEGLPSLSGLAQDSESLPRLINRIPDGHGIGKDVRDLDPGSILVNSLFRNTARSGG